MLPIKIPPYSHDKLVPKILLWIDNQPENNRRYFDLITPHGVLVIQCRDCVDLQSVLDQFGDVFATYPASHLRLVCDRASADSVFRMCEAPPLSERPVMVFCWQVHLAAKHHDPARLRWVAREDPALIAFSTFQELGDDALPATC